MSQNHMCPSVNTALLELLVSLLSPPPSLNLSIGSGTGLLENLLLNHTRYDLIGVEISPTVNLYLPEENVQVVLGTWAVSPAAKNANTILFVYPRDPQLVQKYITLWGSVESSQRRSVIWLGPRSDWSDYQTVFEGWDGAKEHELKWEEGVVAGYEKLVVWKET